MQQGTADDLGGRQPRAQSAPMRRGAIRFPCRDRLRHQSGFLDMNYEAHQQIVGTYCGIMEIIKSRSAVVYQCLLDAPKLDSQALYELCFFEFRMICELIALGCLVAHGDIKETKTKKLQNDTYNAHEIVRALDS
jgi:hypothetical protein